MESNDEIKEYDRAIKETIKEGFFDEQEDEFESEIFNNTNVLNISTNLYESTFQNLNSFNVNIYLKINEKREIIFQVDSDDLDIDTQCVSDLISNIVKKINSKKITIIFENNEFILSLKEYGNNDFYNDNYGLITYDKKSCIHKYDCSFFQLTLKLFELDTQGICFIVKKSSNINLSKKYDDEQNMFQKENNKTANKSEIM